MDPKITEIISRNLGLAQIRVANTIQLIDEGATVPFIARYRKERTGSLDEVQILQIKELFEKFTELEKRKVTVLKTIEEQEKLTPELKSRIENCFDPVELEDLYLPYKPKRRTRATMARENGLEPLSRILMAQFEKHIEERAANTSMKKCTLWKRPWRVPGISSRNGSAKMKMPGTVSAGFFINPE